jgi:hypothetical protein
MIALPLLTFQIEALEDVIAEDGGRGGDHLGQLMTCASPNIEVNVVSDPNLHISIEAAIGNDCQ